MSMLVSLALAASGATLPTCSWDQPGVNPFMGDVVAAVDRYTDIPEAARTRLKARMATRDYDEIVSIGRDAIVGKAQYSSEIRQMYFGANSMCNTVTRAKWTQKMQERGLVYCEGTQCIIVPTVCRNVSRITRLAPAAAAAPAVAQSDPQGELLMDPTGAGNPGGAVPGAATAPGSFAQGAGGGLDGGSLGNVPSNGPSVSGGNLIGPNLGGLGVPFLPPGSVSVVPEVPTVPTVPTLPNTPPLPPVPEPETWAMLLLGLLTLGVAARRRAAVSDVV